MNFDLLNTACQNAILISDDYCLDKSFDIIDKNIQQIATDLTKTSFDIDKFVILNERYIKNKDKYNKFITFTKQFSSRLIDVQKIYDSNKQIWEATKTPFQIIYPPVVDLSEWGTFDQKTGILKENLNVSKTLINNTITKWINDNFPEQKYGLYKNIIVNVFVSTNFKKTFTFNCKYLELCDTSYNPDFIVKCSPCGNPGYQGCNRMGPGGSHQCGNMFSWCPAPTQINTGSKSTGYCRGWEYGNKPTLLNYDINKWLFTGKLLKIETTMESDFDFHLLGYNQLEYSINKNNIWERT